MSKEVRAVSKLFKPWEKGKRVWAPLAVCCALLIAQAAFQLLAPGTVRDFMVVGVRQNGLNPQAPEAVSAQGMSLLKVFLSEGEQRDMDRMYISVRPGSSEAQRLGEKFPLANEAPICARRDDLTEENLSYAELLYSKAAYGLESYLKVSGLLDGEQSGADILAALHEKEREPGEHGEYLKKPAQSENELPDGVLGSMPEGALFDMPETEGQHMAGEVEIGQMTFGESGASGDRAPKGSVNKTYGSGRKEEENTPAEENGQIPEVPGSELEAYYALLPTLEKETAKVEKARNAAEAASPRAAEQVGVKYLRLFLEELGVDTGKIANDYRKGAAAWAVLYTALALIAAVAVWLIAGKSGLDIFWVKAARAAAFLPILGVAGAARGFQSCSAWYWTAALIVLLCLGAAVLAVLLLFSNAPVVRKLSRALAAVGKEPVPGLGGAAALALLEFLCVLVFSAVKGGAGAAPVLYGWGMFLAFWAAADLLSHIRARGKNK